MKRTLPGMTEDILIIQLNRPVSAMQLDDLRKAIVKAMPEQKILLANGVAVEWAITTSTSDAIVSDLVIGADE